MKQNVKGVISKKSKDKEQKFHTTKESKVIPPKKALENLKEIPSKIKLSLEEKIKAFNRAKELLEFDCQTHLKENISHTDKNSIYPLNDKSYYCINCMHSTCPLYEKDKNQKAHLLIKKENYLFFNKNHFSAIESCLSEALNYNKLKDGLKDCLTNSIESLKDELEKLKNRKMKEIDDFFEQTDGYLQNLNKKFINLKEDIENFYKKNEEFYNIELNKGLPRNNTGSFPKNKVDNKASDNKVDISALNFDEFEIGASNRDIENTVFLMNFEIMNLCENRNSEIIYLLKELKKKIDSFSEKIKNESNQNREIISKYFDIGIQSESIEDYYWDIFLRTKKFSDIIQQFRETITDILHRTGNLEKIKDLVDILDSKLKKNSNIIYEQNYFKDTNNNNTNINPVNDNKTTKEVDSCKERRNSYSAKKRTSSKTKMLSSRRKSENKINTRRNDKRNEGLKNNIGAMTLNSDIGMFSLHKSDGGEDPEVLNTHENLERKKSTSNFSIQKSLNFQNCVPKDIILDKRVFERFFAYLISEFYSKNFIKLDPKNENNYLLVNKDNIYLNWDENNMSFLNNTQANNNNKINNTKLGKNNKEKRLNSSKRNKSNNNKLNCNNNKNMIMNIKYNLNFNPKLANTLFSNFESKEINTKINNPFNFMKEKVEMNQYNPKSVSYLSNYTNRYNSLKERAKPIIGTNQIQLFSPTNQKIVRITTTLNKDVHGYSVFPEGCRHLLIDDKLYIIGGTNPIRNPINTVLMYNIPNCTLDRLPDLITAHSYHTVEYFENYDSIICVGGENSASCEIMNLESKKWFKLPTLNIARSNCNLYLNNITGEVFALFGITGTFSEKNFHYCDSIEVLEINNINQGWIKIDYYKTPGLNLKVNYCMTIPFTRNQLLIYGGSNMRTFRKNIYALFNMNKNECIKVDTKTMELIKLEEKKSRLVDLALTKLE